MIREINNGKIEALEVVLGSQDFDNSTLKIIDQGKEFICPMFMDADGDIGFVYNGEEYLLRYTT